MCSGRVGAGLLRTQEATEPKRSTKPFITWDFAHARGKRGMRNRKGFCNRYRDMIVWPSLVETESAVPDLYEANLQRTYG